MARSFAANSHSAPNAGQKRKANPLLPDIESNKRIRTNHGAKQRDARAIVSQTSSKALKNGVLDVDQFVKAREYEVRALGQGMSRSKKALNTRAFQQVPKEMRRRTASHNVKRVPKRLQPRAKKEMIEDNTPTVSAKKRKPTRHMRLRIETAKRLRSIDAKTRCAKQDSSGKVVAQSAVTANQKSFHKATPIKSRKPKVKRASLAIPPLVKAKFRKRQINKTWLPTHMFHAKRARMTPPKEPLWRFAVPITPTAKSYRPTHRAATVQGAVAWDVSYYSTIRLEGQQRSIEGILKALGVGQHGGESLWGRQGEKWRRGTRVWEGFLYERESLCQPIAPATVIWCVPTKIQTDRQDDDPQKRKRALFIRVHPSAFFQTWEEILRLSKIIKPNVSVEDLRFEIGSIEITGPGATEALQGSLWPSPPAPNSDPVFDAVANSWKLLSGLGMQAALPSDILLGFNVQDPRLHYPPRTIPLPKAPETYEKLVELLATWPADLQQDTPALFERKARLAASGALPSQKAINRRRTLTAPGQYPRPSPTDPRIPVLLYSQACRKSHGAKWTLLLPWKCVQPVWYSIMYYPLSTGGQPRFGGLDEQRQLAFESGQPWFPGDFPGTQAGWTWELQERARLHKKWQNKPKSKRVNWNTVKLGGDQKGEIGLGWACQWERLLCGVDECDTAINSKNVAPGDDVKEQTQFQDSNEPQQNLLEKPSTLVQMTAAEALATTGRESMSTIAPGRLVTVHLKLLTRGVPQACARIYRLPSATSGNLRKRWLDLHPQNTVRMESKFQSSKPPVLLKGVPSHVVKRHLAQSFLEPLKPGQTGYPPCPPEEDLIGFITSGNFNLGEGHGSGVGSIVLDRVIEGIRGDPESGKLCVVRNAGHDLGRLARLELV